MRWALVDHARMPLEQTGGPGLRRVPRRRALPALAAPYRVAQGWDAWPLGAPDRWPDPALLSLADYRDTGWGYGSHRALGMMEGQTPMDDEPYDLPAPPPEDWWNRTWFEEVTLSVSMLGFGRPYREYLTDDEARRIAENSHGYRSRRPRNLLTG